MPEEKKTKSNHSVEKTFQLIEVLARSFEPIKLSEIAEITKMPAPTVLRMLSTLEDMGYVNREPVTKGYFLSIKFAYLGNRAREHNTMLSCVHPCLERLSMDCGECACLGVEQNGAVVYLDVVRNAKMADRMVMRYIGNWAPLYCTGIGKMILSGFGDSALDGYLNYAELVPYTPKTIIDPDLLKKELQQIREQGYAMDDEECEAGTVCVAAPIRNFANHVVAALSITGPTSRLTESQLNRIIPKVLDAANQASLMMGFIDR